MKEMNKLLMTFCFVLCLFFITSSSASAWWWYAEPMKITETQTLSSGQIKIKYDASSFSSVITTDPTLSAEQVSRILAVALSSISSGLNVYFERDGGYLIGISIISP